MTYMVLGASGPCGVSGVCSMLAVQETDETVSLIPIEPDQLGLTA